MRSIVLLAGMNVNETPFRFTKEQRDEKQHAFMMLLLDCSFVLGPVCITYSLELKTISLHW